MTKTLNFVYKFRYNNNFEKVFNIVLDDETLNIIQQEKESYPEWTLLNNNRCSICKLEESRHKYCPIAKNLVEPIEFFKNSLSYEQAEIIVETKNRNYYKNTAVQKGLSSLIGIYMTTSGCPAMEKLKPMVRFHLPFATLEETKFRIMSMYLLAQYMLYLKNKTPDWDLKILTKIYSDIKIVNQSFCNRLTPVLNKDASTNAVVILNCFAESVIFTINNESLVKELEYFFKPYLDEKS
jgi:hypothetical protein